MDSFTTMIRRRTTDLLQSLPQSLPSMPSLKASTTMEGTWERISVPPVPRSSHSVDIVGGTAYIFGGEVSPGHLADNAMHAVTLPFSGAPADYFAIKAVAAKITPPEPDVPDVPTVIEPHPEPAAGADAGGKEKDLDDVPLGSPPPPAESAVPIEGSGKGKEPAPALPPVLDAVPPARAGHATAVIGHRIFLFGGHGAGEGSLDERGRVWVFDTRTSSWSHLDPAAPASASSPVASPVGLQTPTFPAPRSGHAAVTTDRPRDFASPLSASRRTDTWAEWAAGDSDVVGIPQRPIVGNVAAGATDEETDGYGTLVVHGGWLGGGRLARDVWAFDVRTRVWRELPPAPGRPRAGAALAISKSRLFRFGGFNGEVEEGGQLDFLELGVDTYDGYAGGRHGEVLLATGRAWQSIVPGRDFEDDREEEEEETTGAAAGSPLAKTADWPGPRSVAGLEAVNVGGGREYLVLVLGEKTHSGSGAESASGSQFWDDIWAFQVPPQGMSAASVTDAVLQAIGRKSGEGKWFRVEMSAFDDEDDAAVGGPGPRGGIATAAMGGLEENGIVVWGGLEEKGRCLGDGWILRLG